MQCKFEETECCILWRITLQNENNEACPMLMFWFTYFIVHIFDFWFFSHHWIYGVYKKSITITASCHSRFMLRITCLVCFHATKTPQSLILCPIINTVCSLTCFAVLGCVIVPIDPTNSRHGNFNHTIAPVAMKSFWRILPNQSHGCFNNITTAKQWYLKTVRVYCIGHIHGLLQDCSISIANALEI